MSTKNDITGDSIRSKALSKQGRDNWDNIFGKKEKVDASRDDKQRPNEADGNTKK